jgi:ankyrin repeat protein
MRHFVLCQSAQLSNGQHAIQSPVDEAQGTILTPVSKLERLLIKGIDPDVRSVHGWTAASTAAGYGQLECMKLLVAYSADLLLTDSNGWSVIHCAITGGHLILLEYLRQVIKQDEEWTRSVLFMTQPSQPDHQPLGPLSHQFYFRCSPIHLAAYNHKSDILQFLRDKNVVRNIDVEAQDGVTPLHFAVCMSSPQTTRWLLENGADIKSKCGKREISALQIAMRWGRLQNTIALIEAGAEFGADSAGITPEMQVDPSICADLLELLPNVGVTVPPTVMEGIRHRLKLKSSGGLYKAIVEGDLEACDSIIAAAPCFPKVLEQCGKCTPLVVALACKRPNIAKLILDHRAPTNGTPCARINHFGAGVSAVEIATQQPVFNPLLEQLLEQSLLEETHWSQKFGYWRPFHIAAVFNPGAIRILADHVLKHHKLFRYVHPWLY